MLGLFLILFMCFFVIEQAVSVVQGFNGELTVNNALYDTLADIPPADILVLGYARPSLEIYRIKNPVLAKHRYFGIMPGGDLSAKKNSPDAAFAGGSFENQEFADWQFAQLPQTRSFLVLVGHKAPFEQLQPHARNTLEKNNCEYQPIFEGYRAQILTVSCAQPGAGG
jgi:hypothetical protein